MVTNKRLQEHQHPTKCICHKGFSGYSSIVARSKFRVGGQVTAPQSLTVDTLDRYLQSPLYPKLLTSQANEIQHIKLFIFR